MHEEQAEYHNRRHKSCHTAPGTPPRRLHALTEDLRPLHTLADTDYIRAFLQIITAHFHCWRRGVQHRELTPMHLTYIRTEDGSNQGMLHDWDAPIHSSDEERFPATVASPSFVPYMAVDLLTSEALKGGVPVLYRHDLEAFIWVLIWTVCCFDNGTMVRAAPDGIHSWDVHDPLLCGVFKRVFIWQNKPIVPASDGRVYGAVLASELAFYLNVKDTERAVKRKAARRRWRNSDDTSTLLPQATRVQEEDDYEHEWSGFWTWVGELRGILPCVAEFVPADDGTYAAEDGESGRVL
ncbi:hypothetical protein ACG7TL_008805 [Trametes sanguinea]